MFVLTDLVDKMYPILFVVSNIIFDQDGRHVLIAKKKLKIPDGQTTVV